MKRQFECYNCGTQNEFEATNSRMELSEAVKPKNTYIIKCESCGKENRIEA
jgi:transcription elongation factor Elf1